MPKVSQPATAAWRNAPWPLLPLHARCLLLAAPRLLGCNQQQLRQSLLQRLQQPGRGKADRGC